MWGGTYFYGSSTRPRRRSGVPAFPNFGVLLYLLLHSLKNHRIGFGNIYGLVFRRSATPDTPRRRGPSGPQFWGFYCTYAVISRTTKFGEVTHIGRGWFRRSATPLHVDKCVARFVSDSWACCLVTEICDNVHKLVGVRIFTRWRS